MSNLLNQTMQITNKTFFYLDVSVLLSTLITNS